MVKQFILPALRFAAIAAAFVVSPIATGSAWAQQSSVLLWPVNPVIETGANASALWLENPGRTPITLQVRIFAWAQANGDNVYASQNDVIGSPPIVTIAPGAKQLVRLTRVGPSPAVAEATYRIVVDEIPTAKNDAAPGASVSFRMRYSLPLFVRGDTYRDRPGAGAIEPRLSWRVVTTEGKRFLEIANGGAAHARLVNASFANGNMQYAITPGLLGYVLPNSMLRYPLPDSLNAAATLVAAINGASPQVIAPATD